MVGFLPAFDNAILGYHDRGRIIDHAHRGLSAAGERVVPVDGRVAAVWAIDADTLTVTPLRRFSRAEPPPSPSKDGNWRRFSPATTAGACGLRWPHVEQQPRRPFPVENLTLTL